MGTIHNIASTFLCASGRAICVAWAYTCLNVKIVANSAKKPEIHTLSNVFWCMNRLSLRSSFLFTSASEAATRAVIVSPPFPGPWWTARVVFHGVFFFIQLVNGLEGRAVY